MILALPLQGHSKQLLLCTCPCCARKCECTTVRCVSRRFLWLLHSARLYIIGGASPAPQFSPNALRKGIQYCIQANELFSNEGISSLKRVSSREMRDDDVRVLAPDLDRQTLADRGGHPTLVLRGGSVLTNADLRRSPPSSTAPVARRDAGSPRTLPRCPRSVPIQIRPPIRITCPRGTVRLGRAPRRLKAKVVHLALQGCISRPATSA